MARNNFKPWNLLVPGVNKKLVTEVSRYLDESRAGIQSVIDAMDGGGGVLEERLLSEIGTLDKLSVDLKGRMASARSYTEQGRDALQELLPSLSASASTITMLDSSLQQDRAKEVYAIETARENVNFTTRENVLGAAFPSRTNSPLVRNNASFFAIQCSILHLG